MNTNLQPPSISALHDALAIARLALNPKAAADYLDELTQVTERHEAALKANSGKDEALERKAQELRSWEAQLKAQSESLNSQATQLASARAALEADKSAHAESVRIAETRVREMQQFAERTRADVEQKRKDFEGVFAARTGDMDRREAALKKMEEAHAAKVAKLRELAA